MNDKFTDHDRDEDIARKLTQISEQTHASGPFAAELEERLRRAHKPPTGWWMTFHQVSPTLRWVGLMVLLAVALSWTIRTLIPAPQPAVENTPSTPNLATPLPDNQNPTPAPEGEGIEFRGAKLFMNIDLPDSPGQTNVYQVIPPGPATVEYAQSLAKQFGINGDVYLAQAQIPGTTAYMVTDGKQQLVVYGENNYKYTSDLVADGRSYNGAENDNAEAIIREFLQSRGFDTNVKLVDSGIFGGYALQHLSPDGLPIEYDNFSQPSIRVTLKENGEVLSMTVVMVNYDPNGLGSFGIISADEALQRLLDDSTSAGKIETSYGGGPSPDYVPPQIWYQDYPDNTTVTIYGNLTSSKAADASKPAIVFLDTVQAIGNTAGLDALDYYTFIEATGQFVVENGVRKFNIETWNQDAANVSVFGGVRRDGDQVIVTSEDGTHAEYVLMNPPADLPSEVNFPESAISVNGALVNGKLYWTILDYFADADNMGGGGGGGGGGLGFYQLNLSGSPIPFPTATAVVPGSSYTQAEMASFLKHNVQAGDTLESIAATYSVSVEDLARVNNITDASMIGVGWALTIPGVPGPTRLDGEEGSVQVQIFQKPDGRMREAYTFISKKDQLYYQMKGENLQQLQAVANRPIKIWGAITYDEMGAPFLTLERFESLYPDLQFEVLTGTQQSKQINGMDVILFTADGTTYIQMISSGGYPDYSVYEDAGEVNLEVLRIPGETFEGYPTVRVFMSGPAFNNETGQPLQLPRLAENLQVIPDPYGNADAYVYPDVIIEHVELVYLTNNPAYRDSENPDAPVGQGYMQPAWHFRGQYSNGNVLDVLVQALKQEYLSPDIDPNPGPG